MMLDQVNKRLRSFLRGHLRKILVILLGSITLIGPLVSYQWVRKTTRFRNIWISSKYEGSQSENLGLLTALTTDFSLTIDSDDPVEVEKSESIRNYLDEVREYLEAVESVRETGANLASSGDLLEEVHDEERLLWLLSRDTVLERLSIGDIGLVARSDPDTGVRAWLETSDRVERPDSFLFIPAPLVIGSGNSYELPLETKREVVFSKIVERHLVTTIRELTEKTHLARGEVFQMYFIPFSGFVRISSVDDLQDHANQSERYRDRFPSLISFSDRTLFKKTREGATRVTEPYIDVAGGGLIRSYTTYVKGPRGVAGVVGIDQRFLSLAENWKNIDLGTFFFRDFEVTLHTLGADMPESGDRSREGLVDFARQQIESNPKENMEAIRRYISEDRDRARTVFTVPLSPDKYACFVFDISLTESVRQQVAALYTLSALAAVLLLVLLTISERRKAKTESIQSAIVDSLHAGLVVADEEGLITASNKQFRVMAGTRMAKGRNLLNFLSAESRREYQAVSHRGAFEFVGRLNTTKGESIPAIISGAKIKGGGSRSGRVLAFIPSRRLEMTIGKKFLDIFSHALKTPAHSILLIADSFRRKRSHKKFDHLFSLMQKEIDQFKNMTDNVLSFSDVDVQLVIERENVAQILRSIASTVRERAKKEGIGLSQGIPSTLDAEIDKQKLIMIVNNLIDNALKYTEEGTIEIWAADRGSEIEISIADTGIGVREEERALIFDRFYRGDHPKIRSKDGMGIGLFVTKRYVEQHNGTLHCEPVPESSNRGQEGKSGTRFVVRLPKTHGAV